ncbi:hypothetical protein SK128_002287 [Halocaridina rubra]|uniref:VWFD domain-containing protein n=1 Tax=Halocaridina rubra TaxID=373956 RepID=A0AAN8X2Q5_HALRR
MYHMFSSTYLEEHEGPYLRVGQISGPGGIGIQVGSGRLIPLDTPPALTLTADVDKEVIEFLFDWQSPSVAQLKEDLSSRGTSLVAAMEGLGRVEIQVEGSLDILDLLEDSQTLLEEAGELISSVVGHIIIHLLDQAPEVKLGEFMTISLRGVIEYLVERVKGPLETLVAWWDVALNFTDRLIETVEASVLDIFEEISYMIDDVVEPIVEVFSDAWNMVESSVRPPLLRIQAAIASLAYNDDQSLYALTSRVMGEVRSEAGRHKGLAGFFYSNILTKVERWLVKRARWDEIRAKSTQILQYLRQFTTFDAVMPHSTALKLRVSTPPKFARDFKSVALKFRDHHWPKLLSESKEWVESQWSRVRYLLTWHIRGESVVFGWDQAITWDGRQVTPMLSDSCHHMLVLLINAQPPTAITIHLKDLNSNPRKVFTVFSGEDRITIDTNLKMTYNNQHVRRPQLEIGELTLTREPGKATVSSSSGLTLECESKFDTCRLEVSWENFAATAGLLGVFDFDNNTDFMTSGWEMPATESEWAQSWRVAGMEECSSALPETDDDQVSEEECTSLFDDTKSPFRSCFFSVPPSPYLETCRTGWSCGSEASYLHACQRHYHDLMPNLTTCGACDPSEIEEEGGTDGLAHEIVIITDFNCLEDMQDLITALVKDQEKTHTIVVRYIGRGTPSYGPFDDVTETVVDSATAPLDAVANAVALDFSPKALKSIVLFDCDHPMCTVSMTSSKFFSLQAELLKQGIQVHVITQDPLLILQQDAFTNKAKRQLIGLDARTIYTMSHARKRQVRGKRRLREHVTTPMGNTCASLAVQTDGAVFSLHQLKIERKYHRKIYQQLLAARVREGQSAEYLNCRKCECNVPCSLCHPQKPFEYAKSTKDDDEDEEDEDYEDEEDEERDKRKKKKKSQRMRGN